MIKKIFMSLSSNVIALFISILTTIIFPKFLGTEEYGLFQLFIFYTSYVGIFNFGICDGIYILKGGCQYKSLDKSELKFFSVILVVIQFLIFFIFLFLNKNNVFDSSLSKILFYIIDYAIIYNLFIFLSYILQATSKIKEYAIVTIANKIVYLLVALISLFFNFLTYKWLIYANIFGLIISLSITIKYCKDIFLAKLIFKKKYIKTLIKCLKIGFRILLANLAGILIIGIVRFGIQYGWDVSTYGKVSLSLSVSNMLITCVNAISIVIFPFLKHVNYNKLGKLYQSIKISLVSLMYMFLLLYYPLRFFLETWIPNYSDSLKYMGIIFPVCIYSCEYALLIVTFYKVCRLEKKLLLSNIITLFISIIFTYLSVVIFHHLIFTVSMILVNYYLRHVLSELYLMKKIKINLCKELFWETIITFSFVVINLFDLNNSFFIFVCILIFYILMNRKKIFVSTKTLYKIFRYNNLTPSIYK